MKELGDASRGFHFDVGQEAALYGISLFLLWGDMAEAYKEGALKGGMSNESIKIFDDKDELVDFIVKNISLEDAVLIKGSRSMQMDYVTDKIIESGDR